MSIAGNIKLVFFKQKKKKICRRFLLSKEEGLKLTLMELYLLYQRRGCKNSAFFLFVFGKIAENKT